MRFILWVIICVLLWEPLLLAVMTVSILALGVVQGSQTLIGEIDHFLEPVHALASTVSKGLLQIVVPLVLITGITFFSSLARAGYYRWHSPIVRSGFAMIISMLILMVLLLVIFTEHSVK
jgi:hypothetical protein